MPTMISRQIFGFCSAYLLGGEQKYLDAAREGVDYLLEYGWDREYGGWFTSMERSGKPGNTTKGMSSQLYTNVGLAQYYTVTGDPRALSFVMKSIDIHKTQRHDDEFGGCYQTLNRDLSVLDDGKNKHAHFGYTSSLLLNLYLATRNPGVLEWSQYLEDLSIERMIDPETGWFYGYVNLMSREWQPVICSGDDTEVVHIGAQLTAALSLLRLHHQTSEEKYLEQGRRLGDMINRYGWNPEQGAWFDLVESRNPHRPVASSKIHWWVQIYGSFLQLQLYRLTGDTQLLNNFRKSETFWLNHFRDTEYGGIFPAVSPQGTIMGAGEKASSWHTSYHEIEHGLLNYLYLNLYVNRQPAELHFNIKEAKASQKHYVSLVDDPSVCIGGVEIGGEAWTDFNAEERSVTLPEGKNLQMKITLTPGA